MGVLNYLPVVNFIAIVIILIILLIGLFKKKDSFNNVPSGYDNLLLSDSDGNLIPFSLSTLQTDIKGMINTAIEQFQDKIQITRLVNELTSDFVRKSNIQNMINASLTPYVKNTDLTNKLANYVRNNQGIYLTAPGAGNDPLIVGSRTSDPVKRSRSDQTQDTLRKFTIQTA